MRCGVNAMRATVAGQASEIHWCKQTAGRGGCILDLDGDSRLSQQPGSAQAGDASTNYEHRRLGLGAGHGASLMQRAGERGHQEGI